MNQISLGKTELRVSRIGFGAIPIQRVSDGHAEEVIKRCLHHGITFLDTANGYSTSEARIGKAIAGRREKLVISTKTHARKREDVERDIKLSLERLKTSYLDIFLFHCVSTFDDLDSILAPGGLMSTIEEAKKAGLIRHIGVSSHQIDVAKKAVQSDRFETIMFAFNFLTPEVTQELLPLAKRHDVGFIAMKPLAGGMIDNATLAFKYLLQFPEVLPIVGIEKVAEIDEIAKLVESPQKLTDDETAEIERIRREVGTTFCHRCDYCQPCTAGITISVVMTAKSNFKRAPKSVFFKSLGPVLEKAVDCVECGDCEGRCPYHLPIRKTISKQYEWFQQEKKKYQEECWAE